MIFLLTVIAAALALLVVVLGMTHDQLKRVANAAEEANRIASAVCKTKVDAAFALAVINNNSNSKEVLNK